MNAYVLVEIGKKIQESPSDRAFALKNGLTVQNISDWKAGRSSPNAANFLKLAIAANMKIHEALEYAEKMEESKRLKEAGFANVFLLGGVSAVSLAVMSHLPYEVITAGLLGANAVYYVKLRNDIGAKNKTG